MGANSQIEWTDATWNPIRGCSRVSEGCRNCYAERVAARFSDIGQAYHGLAKREVVTRRGNPRAEFPVVSYKPHWTGEVRFIEEHLADPLKWRKPKRIFVNSMSDLFHEKVKDEWIDRIFAVMYAAHWHTFQILTKRPLRMRDYVEAPLRHVWLGTSVEDQTTADERIPLLLETPAAVRFVSYEPAIDLIDLRRINLGDQRTGWGMRRIERDALSNWETQFHKPGEPKSVHNLQDSENRGSQLDWVIIGGESGPGARPFCIQWARDVITQCKAAGVACFVKQFGAHIISRNDNGFEGDMPTCWPMETRVEDAAEACQGAPVRVRLKDRKGGDWNEWPEDLRVREYPDTHRSARDQVSRRLVRSGGREKFSSVVGRQNP